MSGYYLRKGGSRIIAGKALRYSAVSSEIEGEQLDPSQVRSSISKWATITKSSQDTAVRDMNDLMEKEILVREEGGGRSTSYVLKKLI